MKKAMITIEVLVSMLILFLVISTSFTNIKFFNILSEKKQSYEEQYIAVLSIKDKISSNICKTIQFQEGEFGGFSYKARCENVTELRTYMKGSEDDEVEGNVGNHLMKLYLIRLELVKGSLKKEYSYYKTIDTKLASW